MQQTRPSLLAWLRRSTRTRQPLGDLSALIHRLVGHVIQPLEVEVEIEVIQVRHIERLCVHPHMIKSAISLYSVSP